MTKTTFLEICAKSHCGVAVVEHCPESSLGIEKHVANTLWEFTSPDFYQSVANQFGVGRSTVWTVLMEGYTAIDKVLLGRVIKLGQCTGGYWWICTYGTYVSICPHRLLQQKRVFVRGVLQGLVDHRYRFTNTNIGWSGKVHNARNFRNSALFTAMRKGTFAPRTTMDINGVAISPHILGNPAYPLLPGYMKPLLDTWTGKGCCLTIPWVATVWQWNVLLKDWRGKWSLVIS